MLKDFCSGEYSALSELRYSGGTFLFFKEQISQKYPERNYVLRVLINNHYKQEMHKWYVLYLFRHFSLRLWPGLSMCTYFHSTSCMVCSSALVCWVWGIIKVVGVVCTHWHQLSPHVTTSPAHGVKNTRDLWQITDVTFNYSWFTTGIGWWVEHCSSCHLFFFFWEKSRAALILFQPHATMRERSMWSGKSWNSLDCKMLLYWQNKLGKTSGQNHHPPWQTL